MKIFNDPYAKEAASSDFFSKIVFHVIMRLSAYIVISTNNNQDLTS